VVGRGNLDSYFSRLHPVLLATLLVFTVGFGLAGWAIRPASGGFAAVPADLELTLTKAPPALTFTESMAASGDEGAVLAITAIGLPDSVPVGPWTLLVKNLGVGRPCTPRYATVEYKRVRIIPPSVEQHVTDRNLSRSESYTRITGSGPFYVQLCWPSNGPVSSNGAYLSARFPVTYVLVPRDSQPITRQLNLGSLDAADYAIQSLQQPTSVTQDGWQWDVAPTYSAYQPEPLSFSAVNTSETQHDSYDAFLSGIAFGVAGGALVSLMAELVAPFRSRQERRSSQPGG
jgi:hypothetical protein